MSRAVTLENTELRVGVAPHYGARVTSLVDKASGRDWIASGGESRNTGEDAVYLGDEAVGWDECFPTVSPWDGSDTPYGRRLRDHGDLWGRPWVVEASTPTMLRTSFAGREYRFTRTLSLEGKRLVADYSVTSLAREPLPYLWALHGLLRLAPGERIELPGVDRVTATYLSTGSQSSVPWPGPGPLPFPLDVVQPASTNFAGKFYASGVAGGAARVGKPGQWLELGWDGSIAHLGIWITYGGWPGPGGHHDVALEPTNTSADHLGQAIAAGAKPLSPGERRDWRVTLTLVS